MWQNDVFSNRKDIDELSQRLQVERERYHMTAETNASAISAVPCFNMNDKFILNRDDASYTLSLEVQTPIDNVLIQVVVRAETFLN